MTPMTLESIGHQLKVTEGFSQHLIWLTTGVRAVLRASFAIGLHASILEAPNASNISVLSRFSLGNVMGIAEEITRQSEEHSLQFLENVTDRKNHARYRTAAQHSYNWDYRTM